MRALDQEDWPESPNLLRVDSEEGDTPQTPSKEEPRSPSLLAEWYSQVHTYRTYMDVRLGCDFRRPNPKKIMVYGMGPMLELTITSPFISIPESSPTHLSFCARVDLNPMPVYFIPQSGDFGFGVWSVS